VFHYIVFFVLLLPTGLRVSLVKTYVLKNAHQVYCLRKMHKIARWHSVRRHTWVGVVIRLRAEHGFLPGSDIFPSSPRSDQLWGQ